MPSPTGEAAADSTRRQKSITMEGSASSSINSRATAIKTILLVAWRNKLSPEGWASRIKKVLPRGVNGDVYDLADCLLKQALVGPVPNQLFMSYLKHAVQDELVSYGAVLRSIANQPVNPRATNSAPSRTSAIVCLLEFLETFRDKISCKESEVECLALCHSIGQLISWLLRCIQSALDALTSNGVQTPQQLIQTQQQHLSILSASSSASANVATHLTNSELADTPQSASILSIIDLCSETIRYFIARPFTKSLLFICKIEYNDSLFDEVNKSIQSIQHKLTTYPSLRDYIRKRSRHFEVKLKRANPDAPEQSNIIEQFFNTFNSYDLHPSVVAAQQLRCVQSNRTRSAQVPPFGSATNEKDSIEKEQQRPSYLVHDSNTNYALFNSLYPLVAFDVVLRPARSHTLLARQVATITNFHSSPINMTYCELIRVCMIGIIDSDGTSCKVQWAFFIFLKLPKLLIELSKLFRNQQSSQSHKLSNEPSGKNHSSTFIRDLELAFERLCEYSPLLDEAEYKCNCDLFKIITKELIKNDTTLAQLKNADFKFPIRRELSKTSDLPSGHKVLKAEPVIENFLESLYSSQDLEKQLETLSQLVAGRQFEFTMTAAASMDRLQMFIKVLVEHNDSVGTLRSNVSATLDASKNPHIQALIFDMTFLILTYIAHMQGPDVIGQKKQSIYHKWFFDCFNPSTRISCPKEMLKNSDDAMVTSLIKQLLHPDDSIHMDAVDWKVTIDSLPRALYEILNAWNQGAVSDDQIEVVIERIKSRMCSLAVVAATWLTCHIKTLDETEKAKPLHILQSLTSSDQKAKQSRHHQEMTLGNQSESGIKSASYFERSSLMSTIIRRISCEIISCKSSSYQLQNLTSNGQSTEENQQIEAVGSSLANNASTKHTNEESLLGELAYQTIYDKFAKSSLPSKEIFMANVEQCLSRGWLENKSLRSLNILYKMIGSECFTDLIVEHILISHESPSDLSRATNITFGLFHIDIEACAFALLKSTIPSWLMGEKKQSLLNQPRAFALARLAVMTIIEVYKNLEHDRNGVEREFERSPIGDSSVGIAKNQTEDAGKVAVNGIKQELGLNLTSTNDSRGHTNHTLNGPKRIKLMTRGATMSDNKESISLQQDAGSRLEKLNNCIANLMRLFRQIMSDPVMSQRSLFPILFLQQTVVCTREGSSAITVHLEPEILLDIIDLFSSELTFELVLAISNLSSTESRKFASKAMCKLAQVEEAKQKQWSQHQDRLLSTSIAAAGGPTQSANQLHPAGHQTSVGGGSPSGVVTKTLGGSAAPVAIW